MEWTTNLWGKRNWWISCKLYLNKFYTFCNEELYVNLVSAWPLGRSMDLLRFETTTMPFVSLTYISSCIFFLSMMMMKIRKELSSLCILDSAFHTFFLISYLKTFFTIIHTSYHSAYIVLLLSCFFYCVLYYIFFYFDFFYLLLFYFVKFFERAVVAASGYRCVR